MRPRRLPLCALTNRTITPATTARGLTSCVAHRIRRALCAAAAFSAVLGAPHSALAQVLIVTVRDTTTRTVVPGAIVSATNSRTGARIDVLTNDVGRASLRLPEAGDWIPSVRRIGIQPRTLTAVRVGAGSTVPLTLTVASARFTLPRTRVTAAAVCGRAPRGADRTAALWEQVSLALRATELARDDTVRASAWRLTRYERFLNAEMTLATARIVSSGSATGRPFYAAEPEALEKNGFVRRDPDGHIAFFAPDERVLLSESFLRTHCFGTPEQDANPALAELEFRPLPGRKVPEVAGVAYVDTTTGELRRLVYRYVNASKFMPRSATLSGGEVTFKRVDSGEWIVSDWVIRMPHIVSQAWRRGGELTAYREAGGLVRTEAEAVADSLADVARRAAADSATAAGERAESTVPVSSTDPSIRDIIWPGEIADGPLFFTSAGRIEARTDFARRKASGDGIYLDSAAIAAFGERALYAVLLRAPGIQLFVVPPDAPPPSGDEDFALALAWRSGAVLPMMALPAAKIPEKDTMWPSTSICYPKIFLDRRFEPVALDELRRLGSSQIATISIHAPGSKVARRSRMSGTNILSRNECGVVQLWSYVDYR